MFFFLSSFIASVNLVGFNCCGCFETRFLLQGPQFQMSCLWPGDRQHAQETDLITGWTLNKDCKIKHEVLEVVSQYFGVFSQVGYAGTIIPVMVKTPALCSMPGVSWHSLHFRKPQIGRMGKSWATEVSVAHQSCVVLQVCRSAVSPGSLRGMCCRAGSRSPPLLRVACMQTAAPAHRGPSRGSHGSSPHTQHLSPWSDSALALRQSRNMHGLATSLVVTNLTNVSMLWMCSRTPSQSGLTKSGWAASQGSCLLCGSCCSTALTNNCSEFSLGMQHHSLSAPGCWSPPSCLKWSVTW